MKKLPFIKGIPLSYIQSILKIDPTSPSGLTWLPRNNNSWNKKFANKNCGCKHTNKNGYQSWVTSVNYKGKTHQLKCSRIIFLLHNGYLTKGKKIDHIDNNSLNNHPENIRESDVSGNTCNSKISKNNTSGTKGLLWNKKKEEWEIRIWLNGKNYYFGHFKNKQEAIKVAIESRKKLHGEFGRDR